MRTVRARCATDESYDLAEGPVWDVVGGRLLWVDIPRGRVLSGLVSQDRVEVTDEQQFPGTVSAVVPTDDGGLLVALRGGFASIDAQGTVRTGGRVLPEPDDRRLNDGACDPAGRFLVGSMALGGRINDERLYRLDHLGAVEVLDDGLTLSNGLGWSPDGQTMYHVDSVPGVVWSRSYDPLSGATGARREHLRIQGGTPDGICVDADGNLWVALWGAGQVRCFDPTGTHVATVDVAAPHTSSVAFVGPGLDRLLITTAREDLSPSQLDAYPRSGHLFLADVGAKGMPSVAWAGRCAMVT